MHGQINFHPTGGVQIFLSGGGGGALVCCQGAEQTMFTFPLVVSYDLVVSHTLTLTLTVSHLAFPLKLSFNQVDNNTNVQCILNFSWGVLENFRGCTHPSAQPKKIHL